MEIYPYMISLGMPEGLSGEEQAQWLCTRDRDVAAKIARLTQDLAEARDAARSCYRFVTHPGDADIITTNWPWIEDLEC